MNGLTTNVTAPASGEELVAGLDFLNKRYQRAFSVVPTRPDYLLTARNGGEIVGTMGVNFAKPGSGLRLARLYGVAEPTIPDQQLIAEFGKWACECPGVSAQLVYSAVRFSLTCRKTHVLCEHTPHVNRAARRFGVKFQRIDCAELDRSMVEDCHRQFYEDNDPQLFLVDLQQARTAIERYLVCH